MTPHYVNQGGELSWLLDDLVRRVPQVSRAVMLTQDGLAIGASAGLSREGAEHLAALAAGFQSMARGAGQHFGGGRVRQTIIEMESAFLFVSAAGQGARPAVLTPLGAGPAGEARPRPPLNRAPRGGQPAHQPPAAGVSPASAGLSGRAGPPVAV